ncbi:MAG: hypothetical protein EAX95_12625 [Candidatus Thorarchaeota archaeon]|nr:hypothetical protein [Candidatus Thorarchaeota archaeon]
MQKKKHRREKPMSHTTDPWRHMSRTELKRELGLSKVVLDTSLLRDIIIQARDFPDVEEGGVLVGFLDQISRTMEIAGFIKSGPKARRTAGSLHCDLDFQEEVFDLAKGQDEELQHLGSWHGHHCNGARNLSGGDLNSYFSIIDSPYHAHDYYFAILLLELPSSEPREWDLMNYFRFYLLSKEHRDTVYRLDSDCVRTQSVSKEIPEIIRKAEAQVLSAGVKKNVDKFEGAWFRSTVGKDSVREDSQFLKDLLRQMDILTEQELKVVSSERGHQLVRTLDLGGFRIEYEYPTKLEDKEVSIRMCRTHGVPKESAIMPPAVESIVSPLSNGRAELVQVLRLAMSYYSVVLSSYADSLFGTNDELDEVPSKGVAPELQDDQVEIAEIEAEPLGLLEPSNKTGSFAGEVSVKDIFSIFIRAKASQIRSVLSRETPST